VKTHRSGRSLLFSGIWRPRFPARLRLGHT
jgi:hypothetical protein